MTLTAEQRQANRTELIDEIFSQTSPERTGRISWDGGRWQGQKLLLDGQHLTPDVEIEFKKGGEAVVVLRRPSRPQPLATATTSWSRNFKATAQNIIAAVTVAYYNTSEYESDEQRWSHWNS